MKNSYKNYFRCSIVLLFLNLIPVNYLYAQDTTTNKEANGVVKESKQETPPTLSEIIPEVALLSEDLTSINNSIDDFDGIDEIADNYKEIAENLKVIGDQFDAFKKDENYSTNELENLRSELNQSGQQFEDSNKTLKDVIILLETSRKEWLNSKKKWSTYEKLLRDDDLPLEAKKSLKSAHTIIDKALNVIGSKLNDLMKLQQSGYKNQETINDLNIQIQVLRKKKITSAFEVGSIPMYSPKFFQQFNSKLWQRVKSGFTSVIFPSKSFFENNWWVYVCQIFVTFFIIYLIRRNSKFLKDHTEFDYFTDRSISAGIFFGFLSVLIFHSDMKSVPLWNLFSFLIGGIAFCYLISNRKVEPWKNNFYYILVVILTFTGFLHVFNLPIVLFRIFIVSISIYCLIRLYRWNKNHKKSVSYKKYRWLFLGLFIYLSVIVFSEIIGKEVLALYMYESLLKSFMLIVFTVVFLNMVRAGIEVVFKIISNGDLTNIDEDKDNSKLLNKTVVNLSTFIGILVFLLGVIPRILVFWNIYNDIPEAYGKLINIGFSIGESRFSLGIIIASISILYFCYVSSTIIEMLLMNERLDRKLEKGARLSIAQLIRYFLMFIGFLLAIAALGFDLTNFTIILSALGVGIGFGLQGVVNNFVSGLILLFERPIREGDTVEIEGAWSNVKKIGLRSTTVHTFDQSDVIIPNSDLVYNKVTNWSLSNNRKRIIIAVGVAYGSDINLVISVLKEIGKGNDALVQSVNPVVLFRDFADSTLNFELRVRAKDQSKALQIESDLREEIDSRFREHNIEIAFPQRDLFIKNFEGSVLDKENKN
ncbi:mechanosensitive ion channel domain-containing protein [Lutibacter holmesii]|uniref:Mechanosensitive ion channel domain-containing protein n=1 Tax=Lutibacter holmesii TaxID=1137985 RepID=A0ABW3WS29_9FLAO